jgi:trehalose 6-phosphate synthase/phosphatase
LTGKRTLVKGKTTREKTGPEKTGRKKASGEAALKSRRERLIVVSNRLPISFKRERGVLKAVPSSGGLVSALTPILQEHGGTWIGSPGSIADGDFEGPDINTGQDIQRLLDESSQNHAYQHVAVHLSEEEQTNFYEGFSNEVVWPLFHDLQSRCRFSPKYWDSYLRVNRKFADAALRVAKTSDIIWIQDYQLMQVAVTIRKKRPKAKLAFFMHIPFPSPDIFEKLPWRGEILDGLLQHDLIGLQTARDEHNFIACLRKFLPDLKVERHGDLRIIHHAHGKSRVQFFPISVDFRWFSDSAQQEQVIARAAEIREQLHNVHIALGVDRLDYTKGIPERLRAFAALLRNYPDLRGKITLFQIVVPSRETIVGYQNLMAEIERSVTHINGEFAETDWVPVRYLHRSIPKHELLALYRAANTAIITPLKDGMNLVSKEYCAARSDNDGVLLLSEFAGAAPQLRTGALLVNPYDEIGVAAALNHSFHMVRDERRKRMSRLRTSIRRSDILHWRDSFFAALEQSESAEVAASTGSA